MSRSGVGVSDQCITKYNELKLGKAIKYIIYKLSDDKKTIVVLTDSAADEAPAGSEAAYEKFLEHLPENDCRYAVYDFEYQLAGGEGSRSKICFYAWSPDDAPVRAKMIYSSSKDSLRRALQGVATEIQGTDFSEVSYESVLEKVSKGASRA